MMVCPAGAPTVVSCPIHEMASVKSNHRAKDGAASTAVYSIRTKYMTIPITAAVVLRPIAAAETPMIDIAAVNRVHRNIIAAIDIYQTPSGTLPVPCMMAAGSSARMSASSMMRVKPAVISAHAHARDASTRRRRGPQVSRVVSARLV